MGRCGRAVFVSLVVVSLCLLTAWGLWWWAQQNNPAITPITARRALGAAMLDGQVYAVGGWNGTATQLNLVEVLDPATGALTIGPSLQIARSQHAIVAAEHQLWVVGGWSAESGLVSAVERFSPTQGNWDIVTHLPIPRREPGVAVWHDQLVIAGGFNGSSDADIDGYSDRVDTYDWHNNRWQRLAKLQVPRRGLTLVAVADRLFAIGGYSVEAGFTNVVEEYDRMQDQWFIRPWPLTPRTWAAATALADSSNGTIVIAGGYNLNGFLDLVERVDVATGAVCRAAPLTTGRAWFAAVPTVAGLWALGGETATGFTGAVELIATNCE